ncbi:MAG: hypothetical protein M0P69_09105 [Bacteroidales bacterium]|jgi:hypothetical protein|nr:hypothetical protein [Bacteroidales bacterium]MDD2569661.1 hypothetical protein [Bacteroidales bacterium]MDD2813067.1 hypothetical protein [Bacteroidales bacterium]MDD3384772.1 hypothetical protein [Bacteroidales bacterium]MDD3810869.1 hypothetical protein [Bacteroidales bacterium]
MTNFNKTLLRGVVFLPLILMVLSSCEKDNSDLRDYVVGQYEYEVKLYVESGDDLVYIGDDPGLYDLTGSMRVIKSSSTPGAVDFYDGNAFMFTGIDFKDTGNAVVFNIPDQEAWIGPVNVQVTGYDDYWEVGHTGYQGAYLFDDDMLEIAFTAWVMDASTGLVMIMNAWRE